jgi:CBS domain-containing protein
MLQTGLDALITYNPWTLAASTPLSEAVRLLDETGIGHWPIVDDEGHLIGSLSTEPLVAALERDMVGSVSVSEIMQRVARCVRLDSCPLDALRLMRSQGERFLPVVEEQRVVGTISPGDFLREVSYGESQAGRELIIEHMHKAVDPLESDQTVPEALAWMSQRQQNYAAVSQGDFPLGAVSRPLLLQARGQTFGRQLRGEAAPTRTLGQLLHCAPTIPPGRTLGEAASMMVEHSLDAIAVANQAAHLLGIITEDQILGALLAE